MKLTPVVALLIAAASAEDTCKNGLTVHKFIDSSCDKKVADKNQ